MNKIIVFGGSHHNTLGLVRSVGMMGQPVILLLHTENWKDSGVRFSRYISKIHHVSTAEEGVDVLRNEYWDEKERPILLFSSDSAVLAVDSRYAEFKDHFIFFNARGRISHYMDKINTFPIAGQCGMTLIETRCVHAIGDIPNSMIFPCLVKGGNSTGSKKSDMCICWDMDELREHIHNGTDYLLQDYIDKEYEINIVGLSCNHGESVFLPAVIRKIRDEMHRQSVYMRLESFDLYPRLDLEGIRRFIGNIGYEGIFSVELLYKDGKYYFLEINMRNDGCGFLYTAAGVNYPWLWILYSTGKLTASQLAQMKPHVPFYLVSFEDVKNMLEGKISIWEWLRALLTSDAHFVFNIRDMKPFWFGMYIHLRQGCRKLLRKS